MTVGILVFPGSNCDWDTAHALSDLGVPWRMIWYTETQLEGITSAILPGGFSYGDYLRSGALAAHAPVMDVLERRVKEDNMPVLGICNGFQILCEREMLPGALRNNADGEFRSTMETVRVTAAHPLFPGLEPGDILRLPIAHHEGAYTVSPGHLSELFEEDEVLLQYADLDGQVHAYINPNGSVANIAGVVRGSVVGLMPHPERAMHQYLGSDDGRRFLSLWIKGVAADGS